ncbi:MAG: hypothetical protein ACJAXQ_001788, partial [Parvibaculaceae bacterium]
DLMVPACLMGGTYIVIPSKGNIDKMAYFPFKYTELKDLKRYLKTKTFELEPSTCPYKSLCFSIFHHFKLFVFRNALATSTRQDHVNLKQLQQD